MRIYPGTTVDYEFATLGGLGYTGTLNDRQFAALRAEGLTGSLPDMFKQFDGTLGGGFVPPVAMSLTNSGAEAGDTSGWTAASGGVVWSSINTSGVAWPSTIYEGSRYFWAGSVVDARMYQDADVSAYATTIDAGGVVAEMTCRFSTLDNLNDYFSIFVRTLNSVGTVLSTVSQQELRANDLAAGWLLQDLNLLLPSGTRSVRVEVHATRTGGTDNDVHLDAVTLTLYSNSRRITPTFASSISSGDRTATITVSATNITAGGGSLSGLVDGSQANDYFFATATGNGTGWLKFDFGSGASWVIDEFIWRQHNNTSHGTWRWEGSNDDSTWTQIGSDFTLRSGLNQPGGTSTTGYRYYRLRHMSGSRSTSPFLREIQFRAKTP